MWGSNPRRRRELPGNWRAIRATVLRRDGGRCRLCGRPGNHVDHIDRLGPHDLANLRTLCERCHMIKTQADGTLVRNAIRDKARRPATPHPGLAP